MLYGGCRGLLNKGFTLQSSKLKIDKDVRAKTFPMSDSASAAASPIVTSFLLKQITAHKERIKISGHPIGCNLSHNHLFN